MICLCGGESFQTVYTYDSPPPGETQITFPKGTKYHRSFLKCDSCGHYLAEHRLPLESLYKGGYVQSTYHGMEGIQRAFQRIRSLDPSQSDNIGRVERINHFWESEGMGLERTLLDVGSGLCVFLDRMKQKGWRGTAVDPDPLFIQHAEKNVGVRGIEGDFRTTELPEVYGLITLNKVLEHLSDPLPLLQRSLRFLAPGGLVYVELPDGVSADRLGGKNREEFFVEHYHAFSPKSFQLLAEKAGFELLKSEQIQEPSSKFTIYGFLCRRN